MAIKKSQIYRTLWNSCDLLRGAMDASQYKDYVLVLLFVKYVSDKAKNDLSMIVPVPEDCRIIGTGSSTQKSGPMYLSPMIPENFENHRK